MTRIDPSKRVIQGASVEEYGFKDLVVVKDFDVPVYPGLHLIDEVKQGGAKPTQVIIEGENYYALESLMYTHGRSIDLIYIDPPYNTGTDDCLPATVVG